MDKETRIVLTGFMGVGKSTVARFLSSLLDCKKVDLDSFIERNERRTVAEIIKSVGEADYRRIETENLRQILECDEWHIVALGGGAWTIEENRRLIKERNFTTVWLESSFEHCWRNIRLSKRVRPLAVNRLQTERLFEERQRYYSLADWHFVVKPDLTSFEIARKIAEEVFSAQF